MGIGVKALVAAVVLVVLGWPAPAPAVQPFGEVGSAVIDAG